MTQRHIYKFALLLPICLIFLLAIDIQPSFACSGGAPLTVAGLIKNSDYVVKARMIEQDDANQNMIIQVEQYLAGGSGPEYLLLNRTDPLLVDYINNGRSTGGDCLGLSGRLDRFDSFYGFLRRMDDGSYFAVTTLFNTRLYQFHDAHSTLEVYLEGGHENGGRVYEEYAVRGTGIEVTEQEFVDIILEEGGEIPVEPDKSQRYPLKSPLLIQTTSQSYLLPIDWQIPTSIDLTDIYSHFRILGIARYYVELTARDSCDSVACIRISPDKLNIAVIRENDIAFTYDLSRVEGQELLFSLTSDAVAVWNNCDLNIYTTGYPRLGQEWYQLELVNSLTISAESCVTYHAQATWTPDGRQLAFTDNDGIKLWDVFTEGSSPNLLVESNSDSELAPNHFSPLGRYLNFSQGNVAKYLDMVSGQIIADGYISPDDKLIVTTDESDSSQEYLLCSLLTTECQMGWSALYLDVRDEATGERIKLYAPSDVQKTAWVDESMFLQVVCDDEESYICGVYRWRSSFHGWYGRPISIGFDFTHNKYENVTAILKDEHTILIDGVEIDTSLWFDEAIVSIEWLPSLFYYD